MILSRREVEYRRAIWETDGLFPDCDRVADTALHLYDENERLRVALEKVKHRFDAYSHGDIKNKWKNAVSESLVIVDDALAETMEGSSS